MLPSTYKLILCLLSTSTPSNMKGYSNFTNASNLILRLLGLSSQSIVKGNLNITEYVPANNMLVGYKNAIDCES